MNALFQQNARMGRLATCLGPDTLALTRLSAEEHLNDLFTFQVEAIASRDDLDFDALISTHATVTLLSYAQPDVSLDGIVTEAELLGAGDGGWRYALTLRPWLWLASLRRKQQIFHEMTVVDILNEVLGDYAYPVDNRLTGEYPILEYTVQYRETDLAFLCRQMERFGISYHFTHDDGAHTLVLTDNISAHQTVPGSARKFMQVGAGHEAKDEHLWSMRPAQRLTTGKVRLTDYNFKTPDAAMETERSGGAPYTEGEREAYDYPGDYLAQGSGNRVARLRIDQERGQDARHRAEGDCANLRPGLTVKITGDAVPGVGKSLCLSARHTFAASGYGSGADEGETYRGSYLLMPGDAPLRPEHKTPRAIVQGPQTAKVVGDGEIDCDEYGRILVRFHWDLDDRFSMRCRVSQNWAGKGWGGMVIPRIGMEVVVEFLEGDPDKPLVTGCVYNGRNDTPYPLPAHKTKSVFRSDTHKGSGFNEFTFEDEKGEENISLHAQKDQTLKVLNNRSKRVDQDQVESVGRNKAINVGKNHQENIGGSLNLSVGSSGFGLFAALGGVAAAGGKDALAGSEAVGNKSVSSFVGGLAAVGAMTEGMTAAKAASFAGAGNHGKAAGAEQVAAGAALGGLLSSTMPISGVLNTVVEKFVSDTIGLARTEQIGAFKNTSVGHTMTVHVGKEFMINCGKSKFVMDSDGNVTIIGTKFNFSASGNVQINGKVIDLN